jgi:hypothetical protein
VGTDRIGVHFSMSPLTQTLGNPIPVVPQVETASVVYDTQWRKLTFTYAAAAPYQYMTIGNFYGDAATQKQSFGSGTYANYGAYYYIDDVIVEPAGPLPVEWLYLRAEALGTACRLAWATASETGTSHFVVQKSFDGRRFDALGAVPAAGYSTLQIEYTFDDDRFYESCYYRLKQVDLDGDSVFSEIVRCIPAHGADSLWLVEEGGTLRIEGTSNARTTLRVGLFNESAQQVRRFPEKSVTGRFAEQYSLAGLARGRYLVLAEAAGRTIAKRLAIP